MELETNTYLKPENLVSLSCVEVKTAPRVSPREQDAHSIREVKVTERRRAQLKASVWNDASMGLAFT